jgi:hypothetical protein
MLKDHPANRPAPGTAIVTDKGLAGEGTEEFFASPGLDLTLIRPARRDESPRYFPNWLRQRVPQDTRREGSRAYRGMPDGQRTTPRRAVPGQPSNHGPG